MRKKIGLIIFLTSLYLLFSIANAGHPVFEKVKIIALTGEQSKINPACWFWEKHVSKDMMDFIFVVGYCKSDGSFILARIEGPQTVMLAFDGKGFFIFFLAFGQIVDVMAITEERAIEFAEKYFEELDSFKLINKN